MTYKEYITYLANMKKVFADLSDQLEKIENEDGCISLRFLKLLNHLLSMRMQFCMTCSSYWRAQAERSFWFMKRPCIRRAISYENLHRETLHQRINVEIRMAQIMFNTQNIKC